MISTERLDLLPLTVADLDAIIAGDRAALGTAVNVSAPDWQADPRFVKTYRPRLAENPGWGGWLMRAIVLREPERVLAGHIGFHLGPDEDGAVEVGYTIFPAFRNRGLAAEAARGLIAWAEERGARKIIASISPTNAPSLRVAEKLGFVQTGAQWDEEDGEELVFELVLREQASPRP